jgi:hypothetical protein
MPPFGTAFGRLSDRLAALDRHNAASRTRPRSRGAGCTRVRRGDRASLSTGSRSQFYLRYAHFCARQPAIA